MNKLQIECAAILNGDRLISKIDDEEIYNYLNESEDPKVSMYELVYYIFELHMNEKPLYDIIEETIKMDGDEKLKLVKSNKLKNNDGTGTPQYWSIINHGIYQTVVHYLAFQLHDIIFSTDERKKNINVRTSSYKVVSDLDNDNAWIRLTNIDPDII